MANKIYDRPIEVQRIDESSEIWETVYKLHAAVNKAKTDNEYLNAGAIQAKRSLVFEIRYFAGLEAISFDTQSYRILFNGVVYNITDFDDFMLKHRTVKLVGVSY